MCRAEHRSAGGASTEEGRVRWLVYGAVDKGRHVWYAVCFVVAPGGQASLIPSHTVGSLTPGHSLSGA